jgi:hypothetical protein
MKTPTAVAWAAHWVRLTAVGWGLTSVLACVAVSACTSGSGSGTSVFTPSASISVSVSISPGDGTSTATGSPTTTVTPTPTPTPTPIPTQTVTVYPTAAPITGGGGTAGFQDAGLAILGGAAIVAGAGSIIYRRRMTRKR